MKLHFLGQTYTTSNDRVETIPSDYTARFLGKPYHLRRPIETFKSPLGIRKYRGITYGS